MAEFSSKIASKEDEENIRTLCIRSVGKDDYVLGSLEIAIKAGGLFLALHGNRVAGMANFQKVEADNSAWLSMARTDPEYRGRRVAGFLQSEIASHARKCGLRRMRFLINSSNAPSIKSALRGGFKPVAETVHVSFTLRKKKKPSRKPEDLSRKALSQAESSSIVSSSRNLELMNGFLSCGWHFEKASEASLRSLSKQGRMFTTSDGVKNTCFLFGCAEGWDQDRTSHSEFFVLTGSLAKTLEAVKEFAGSLGLESIGTFLPYSRYLIRIALNENLFKADSWADHAKIFERRISRAQTIL